MGLLDNIKSFVHSITTEDHYASYDSPYRDSMINDSTNLVNGANSSTTRLNELNNGSSVSLVGDGARNSSTFVNYRPGLRSSNTNVNGSDLQLQTLNRNGQPPLPSIDSLWDRLERWLEEEYPELYDSLNDGVTTADLNEFEKDLGCGALPVEFRQLYKRCDGQFRGGKPTGLILGLVFLDLESIIEEHAIWLKVAARLDKQQYLLQKQDQQNKKLPPIPGSSSFEGSDEVGSSVDDAKNKLSELNLNNTFIGNQRSIPPNSIQPYYAHKGWVPICRDYFGNQIALDFTPGPAGSWGQVIIFGRDFDTKLVIAANLQEFLFNYITDLENGNFQIDQKEVDTSYGYLDSSRNDDDYYIGDEDEGQGELLFYDKEKEFGKVGTPLTYLDVLKRRTLKKYGVTNVDKFMTSFVPEAPPRKPQDEVRSVAGSNSDLSKVSSPLINVESTSKVDLPKETIIGDKKDESKDDKDDTKDDTIVLEDEKDVVPESVKEPEPVETKGSEESTEPKEVKEESKDTKEEPTEPELTEPKEDAKEKELQPVAI